MFVRGHKPDHAAVVARRAGLHLHPKSLEFGALASSLPTQTTNRARLQPDKGGPGNLNQQDVGACEGFAHAAGATLFLANQAALQSTTPIGLISPIQLYLGALLIDRQVNPDGTLAAVLDTGTMPSSIDAAWVRFGACLARDDDQYPASQGTLYQDPLNPNSALKLPTMEKLFADSRFKYKGQYFITSLGPQRTLDALTVLASGRPITNAIAASGPEFQGYTGGVLSALSGDIDHANLILDYTWTGGAADWQTYCSALRNGDTSTAARLGFNMIWNCDNSWQPWGEGDAMSNSSSGLYRGDMNYFNGAQDLSVLDLVAA